VRRVRLASPHAVQLVPLALFAVELSGCGRRATPADCQLIVDRSVELSMKETDETDPKLVAAREAEVRSKLGDELKSCESLRVTDKTMACVRGASTTEELDKCLH
jgi:hypothetical protein